MPDLYLRQRPDGSVYFGPADAVAPAPPPHPPPGKAWGIAWSGLEYTSSVTDRPDLDLTPAAATFFAGRGVKLFRLAFNWPSVQPALNQPLDTAWLDRLKRNVQVAADAGCKVVLDPHNYGRYQGNVIGSAAVPNAAFKDFWARLATAFKGNQGVWAYGLMNEPHDSGGLWIAGGAYQAGIDGIRSVDQAPMILVPGDNWTGADQFKLGWTNDALHPVDPANRFAVEAHCYFDDGSGKYNPPTLSTWSSRFGSIASAQARIKTFTEWLTAHAYNGWIGEWGVPAVNGTNDEWMPLLAAVYARVDAHPRMIGASLWVTGGPGVGDPSSWHYNGSMAVPVGADANVHWDVLSKYPTGAL